MTQIQTVRTKSTWTHHGDVLLPAGRGYFIASYMEIFCSGEYRNKLCQNVTQQLESEWINGIQRGNISRGVLTRGIDGTVY